VNAMKRRATKVVLFLLLGAIVNVAVAWACHLTLEERSAESLTRKPTQSEIEWWRQQKPAAFVAEPYGVVEWRRPGRTTVTLTQNALEGFVATFGDRCQLLRSGWPCPSMEQFSWNSPAKAIAVNADAMLIPPTWQWPFAERNLPLRPHWPGFIVNTLVYALTLWIFFAALGRMRRMIRRRRGLCPACAYPVGQSPTCTECGAAVNQNRARQEAAA
jgi:hypothetical protein